MNGRRALAVLLVLAACLGAAAARANEPVTLRVVGGLANVAQFDQHEAPFWRERLPAMTQGLLRAEIMPFDRSGLRAQEMVRLIRLGVVSFGTILSGVAAADDPVLGVFEQPLLFPSAQDLRRVVDELRGALTQHLRERHQIELLAVYAYPAQVVWCRDAFTSLDDLRGRRVRVSGVSQLELMAALGASPVVLPFAETPLALRSGAVTCAVTGTLTGYQIGLPAATRFLSAVPITWGVSFFAANPRAWDSLSATHQAQLRRGIAEVEAEIWRAAEEETATGIGCATGRAPCPAGPAGSLTLVGGEPGASRLAEIARTTVLPNWFDRCGEPCRELWSRAANALPSHGGRPR
ncbi:MAG: TRAP transporter substrate-binding protein [Acetobacteraceae bacterium]|nr:TRAP transporter substrate-binding protein [Acetobacteraceae bacterium]